METPPKKEARPTADAPAEQKHYLNSREELPRFPCHCKLARKMSIIRRWFALRKNRASANLARCFASSRKSSLRSKRSCIRRWL